MYHQGDYLISEQRKTQERKSELWKFLFAGLLGLSLGILITTIFWKNHTASPEEVTVGDFFGTVGEHFLSEQETEISVGVRAQQNHRLEMITALRKIPEYATGLDVWKNDEQLFKNGRSFVENAVGHREIPLATATYLSVASCWNSNTVAWPDAGTAGYVGSMSYGKGLTSSAQCESACNSQSECIGFRYFDNPNNANIPDPNHCWLMSQSSGTSVSCSDWTYHFKHDLIQDATFTNDFEPAATCWNADIINWPAGESNSQALGPFVYGISTSVTQCSQFCDNDGQCNAFKIFYNYANDASKTNTPWCWLLAANTGAETTCGDWAFYKKVPKAI